MHSLRFVVSGAKFEIESEVPVVVDTCFWYVPMTQSELGETNPTWSSTPWYPVETLCGIDSVAVTVELDDATRQSSLSLYPSTISGEKVLYEYEVHLGGVKVFEYVMPEQMPSELESHRSMMQTFLGYVLMATFPESDEVKAFDAEKSDAVRALAHEQDDVYATVDMRRVTPMLLDVCGMTSEADAFAGFDDHEKAWHSAKTVEELW